MNNFLSYSTIIEDRNKFRRSGTKTGSDFNIYDIPASKYFKIFFYFNNGDSENSANEISSGGLLSPTWMYMNEDSNYYEYNSAWSYLKMNFEDERADLLVKFINLLSNISTESPWYFNELNGLDTALERKQVVERDFKFDEQRQKISIKCLQDAYDDRIGTLLDLYRSIVWSWSMKREIIPSNLRKFDMGVFIYNDPINLLHVFNEEKDQNGNQQYSYSNMGINDDSKKNSSYKYIEFHNCEFDYNSSKGNFSTISNSNTGLTPEYNIDIYFDDCYEMRFNEFFMKDFGDFIMNDMLTSTGWANVQDNDQPKYPPVMKYENVIQEPEPKIIEKKTNIRSIPKSSQIIPENWNPSSLGKQNRFKQFINGIVGTMDPAGVFKDKNFLSNTVKNAANQLVGAAMNKVESTLKKAILGNIYTFSLSRLSSQIGGALQGDVMSTMNAIREYKNDKKNTKNNQIKYINEIGNIFEANTIANNL